MMPHTCHQLYLDLCGIDLFSGSQERLLAKANSIDTLISKGHFFRHMHACQFNVHIKAGPLLALLYMAYKPTFITITLQTYLHQCGFGLLLCSYINLNLCQSRI